MGLSGGAKRAIPVKSNHATQRTVTLSMLCGVREQGLRGLTQTLYYQML